MIKILMICHGNICRSPMAQYIMQDMVEKAGVESMFEISSAATSSEELGNGVYPPVRKILESKGIVCSGHSARKMKQTDYQKYDLLIGMESANIRNMMRITGGDPEGKMHLLGEYTDGGEIDDPWYTRNFSLAYEQIADGVRALYNSLINKRNQNSET